MLCSCLFFMGHMSTVQCLFPPYCLPLFSFHGWQLRFYMPCTVLGIGYSKISDICSLASQGLIESATNCSWVGQALWWGCLNQIDPKMNASFALKSKEKFNPKWYKGEPVSRLFVLTTKRVLFFVLVYFNQSKISDSLEFLITYFIYCISGHPFLSGDECWWS